MAASDKMMAQAGLELFKLGYHGRMRSALLCALALFSGACVSPPRPTAAAMALERNRRAVIEGRVRDTQGRPAPGLRVEALPHGKDIPWSAPGTTDSQGRFSLTLFAPAQYGFVLCRGETSIVTSDPRDPSRVLTTVEPGARLTGIELLFLREEWDNVLGEWRAP